MKQLMIIADAYKYFHKGFYLETTTYCESTWTPRSFKHLNIEGAEYAIHYGVHYLLRKIIDLEEDFFNSPLSTTDKIEYDILTKRKTSVTFDDFKALWELGYFPIEIKSLPDKAKVVAGTPVLTISKIFKDPITDQDKKSQKGLTICKQNEDGIYYGVDGITSRDSELLQEDEKKIVYRNGECIVNANLN